MSHAANEKAVYKQIAVDIAAKVVSGKYQPGQKIRGRSALASQYNVSPETVRRAVFLLSQVGVLEVRQGSGITILSVENAEEFLSMLTDAAMQGDNVTQYYSTTQIIENIANEFKDLCKL